MAKRREEKKEVYLFPSRFGSHASMVVEELADFVVCKDEFGFYLTSKCNLDNGVADPNRNLLPEKRLEIYQKIKTS